MSETLRDIVGMRAPAPKNFPKAVPLACPDKTLLMGIELEIEKAYAYDEWGVAGIEAKDDGSLRDGGKEFITMPMTYSNLVYCLDLFFNKSKVTAANYSERCSIHVHANCQDLTVEQLQTLLILYQTFEGLLFAFEGNNRQDNIFCVPWSQTALTHSLFKDFNNVFKFKRWQKYTALNLLPLMDKGTVEFRHMAGHCNREKLYAWLRIIGCLFAYARVTPVEALKKTITDLNTNSHYQMFLSSVFGNEFEYFVALPRFEEVLEQDVLNVKYALLTSENTKQDLDMGGVEEYLRTVNRLREQERAIRAMAAQERQPAPPTILPPVNMERQVRENRVRINQFVAQPVQPNADRWFAMDLEAGERNPR